MHMKKGFTLLESVIVLAIIVLLAGTAFIAVNDSLEQSGQIRDKYNEHVMMVDEAGENIRGVVTRTMVPLYPSGTSDNNSSVSIDGGSASGQNSIQNAENNTNDENNENNANNAIEVGDISILGGYVTSGRGVRSISVSGNCYSISIANDDWNATTIMITVSDAGDELSFENPSARWYFGDGFPDLYSSDSWVLNDAQRSYLETVWGISIR